MEGGRAEETRRGGPSAAAIDHERRILDCQRRTMEMMYIDIAQAIQAKGIDAKPKDYRRGRIGARACRLDGADLRARWHEEDEDVAAASTMKTYD